MIEFKDVSYSYDKGMALSHVNLSINTGEFVAIVGHNGSGKSTLAKHMNALLLPTEGKVFVNDLDTSSEENILAIRQRVGMVFQNPDNQMVTTIVEEDVAFGPENLGVAPDEIRRRVDGSLEQVGMQAYAQRAPHMLSGGQKQRVAIAGMLAMRPQMLVLDEATAMLDPQGRREVLDIVKRLNRENGMGVVMITQYMEEAVLADRVVVMANGEIKLVDTPKRIFTNAARLRSLGIDAPAMVVIRDELMLKGVEQVKDKITVEEIADALCPLLLKN